MSVTIRDVARLAKVSVTTVSRVINKRTNGVSEETRLVILNVIKQIGYKPNAISRSLVTKKTKTIDFVILDISNQFYPDIAKGN